MAIRKKLDDGDLAALEMIEDEVWLPEFLRNTADGESDKNLWPSIPWRHRDYQRMILTDRSKYLSLLGGRAIGKCEPGYARILVVGEGYVRLDELAARKSFTVYAMSEQGKLVQARAAAQPDEEKPLVTVETESGFRLKTTTNHPYFTDRGWVEAKDLSAGDYVAVLSHMPNDSIQSGLRWHELRFLGYTILTSPVQQNTYIRPRFKRIGKELEEIAERFPTNWHKNEYGDYSFVRIKGPLRSPMKTLQYEMELSQYNRWWQVSRSFPKLLMRERTENIKIFLEALFAQYGELSFKDVSIIIPSIIMAQQLRTLLLYFGIEVKIEEIDKVFGGKIYNINHKVSLLDYESVYKFWQIFNIPGVTVNELPKPVVQKAIVTDFLRFDKVKSAVYDDDHKYQTFSMYVYEHNNYFSSGFLVHNTVILEDKIIYEVVNYDREFPDTQEQLLTTANQAQMTPLLNKLIQRFTSSKILKQFLKGNVNRSDGTLRFPARAVPFTLFFRIAGSKGENNVVGLHVPRIKIDESQIYPPKAFTQLLPSLNTWQAKFQLMLAGVPNGLRNSVLYIADQKDPKYKKYRIPSHNNPFYSMEQDRQNLREWGGENDDRYRQLVLGQHGSAAFQVISREDITVSSYPFYSYRYNSAMKLKGTKYADVLELPRLPDSEAVIMAIDPGFVDPTLIQILGLDKKGIWRTYIRYTLTRIDFNEQTVIIDWLASNYGINSTSIDTGSGGSGSALIHNLVNDERYASKNYANRVHGVNFSERLIVGVNEAQQELTLDAKSYAATTLIRMLQDGELIFSDVDHEGISQLERMAKQRSVNGREMYYILSDKGAGQDGNDHIFASYICFALALDYGIVNNGVMKKLGKVTSTYT
jgi:hypothetical protein